MLDCEVAEDGRLRPGKNPRVLEDVFHAVFRCWKLLNNPNLRSRVTARLSFLRLRALGLLRRSSNKFFPARRRLLRHYISTSIVTSTIVFHSIATTTIVFRSINLSSSFDSLLAEREPCRRR